MEQHLPDPGLSLGVWAAELLLSAQGALTDTHGLSAQGISASARFACFSIAHIN